MRIKRGATATWNSALRRDEALLARKDLLEAFVEAHRYAIDIESLTGAALSSPARQQRETP